MRFSPAGPTIVNQFNLDGNANNQYVSMANGCNTCPKVPDLKFPLPNEDEDSDGEWGFVGAEFNNGQTISIKYKKNYYELKSTGSNDPCEENVKTSKSEEKLNNRMLGLMEEMHKTIASKIKVSNI